MLLELPKSEFPEKVVEDVVMAALRDQAHLARLRLVQFQNECRAFEERFQMTTDDFAARFEAGELGDNEEWFDWFAARRGRELWRVKALVLDEVAE